MCIRTQDIKRLYPRFVKFTWNLKSLVSISLKDHKNQIDMLFFPPKMK